MAQSSMRLVIAGMLSPKTMSIQAMHTFGRRITSPRQDWPGQQGCQYQCLTMIRRRAGVVRDILRALLAILIGGKTMGGTFIHFGLDRGPTRSEERRVLKE